MGLKIMNKIYALKEKLDLCKLEYFYYDTDDICPEDKINLNEIFNSKSIIEEWNKQKKQIESMGDLRFIDGIDKEEQKALYFMIRALKPKSILEIGTYSGCSTFYLALAIKDFKRKRLITVDIEDVNNPPKHGFWANFNPTYSPKDLIKKINADKFTQFKVSNSLYFLDNCEESFDLIFLDGSHLATTVYQEIILSFSLLNGDGLIVLHDYYPDKEPTAGVILAIEKILEKNKGIKAMKIVNKLALLCRRKK